jgi:hypothetical protein
MHRYLTTTAIVLALSALGAAQAPTRPGTAQPLTVHEWGTFTSVAGQDGSAVEWLPLSGPPDLPCFVELPSSVARVFVGRIELVTAATERAVAAALDKRDLATLAKYGRFLQPIANLLLADRTEAERRRVEGTLQPFYAASVQPTAPACR